MAGAVVSAVKDEGACGSVGFGRRGGALTSFRRFVWLCLTPLLFATSGAYGKKAAPTVEDCLPVSQVWSGHPVGFFLLTQDDVQYVAYYDEQRRLTVAQRDLSSRRWKYAVLDSVLGWDSHNYVTMAVDGAGFLHLAGNMHCNPLVYYRSAEPGDADSLKRIPAMVGQREQRCTYPRFLRGPQGELIFTYRDGGSGRGARLYNVYDVSAKTWRRLLERPLLDGKGLMNAYPVGPAQGPDGWFHLCWVWRDTPDCSTNHDLCYARSKDLAHWETAAGEPVELPMTIETRAVVVDPVPAKGGMINGNTRIGFDSQRRPVVSYHKFDGEGNTQVYNARFEDGRWRIYQTSDWDYRWFFEGGGSIPFEVRVSPVRALGEGALSQPYRHGKYGAGTWRLDEATFKPVGTIEQAPAWPAGLSRPRSDFPGMQVRWQGDSGASGEPGVRYALRWETLGRNRDRPREIAPPPSTLALYKLKQD